MVRESCYRMFVDQVDGQRMGAPWLLAARSARSLVYLPMRCYPVPPAGRETVDDGTNQGRRVSKSTSGY